MEIIPELSISIVNFNAKDKLRGCLKSILQNTKEIDYEVIVVDNASSDGSKEMVKDEFPHVKLIVNVDNKGVTLAKNQSFRVAQGGYILILDSDIELLPGAVKLMLDFLKSNPEAGIVGPKVLFPDFRQQHSCNKGFPGVGSTFLNRILFFAPFRYRFYHSRIGSLYLKIRYNRTEEFAWLGGMCLLVRAGLIRELGGVDEHFFIYYDDTDLCFSARKLGEKIYYLPASRVIHHLSESVGKFSNFLFPKIYQSEIYFERKHYGVLRARICARIIQASMFMRIAISFAFLFWRKDTGARIGIYRQVISEAQESLNAKAA